MKIFDRSNITSFINETTGVKIWEEEKPTLPFAPGSSLSTPGFTGRFHFTIITTVSETTVGLSDNDLDLFQVHWELIREEFINNKEISIFKAWENTNDGGFLENFEGSEIGIEKSIIRAMLDSLNKNQPNQFQKDKIEKIIGFFSQKSFVSNNQYLDEEMSYPYEFDLEDIDDDIIYAYFFARGRSKKDTAYFDLKKGDVLYLQQGYLSSVTGGKDNQKKQNNILARRIMNHEPFDDVNDVRYSLIEYLYIPEFLNTFESFIDGNELYLNHIDNFKVDIVQYFSKYKNYKLEEIVLINESFNLFITTFINNYPSLEDNFNYILDKTMLNIGYSGILKSINN